MSLKLPPAKPPARRHLPLHGGVAEAVVGRALLAIGEHIVGLGGLLELLSASGIVRVAIRVILHRDPAIGLLDLLLVSAALTPRTS
jgi:hypothetical protein